MLSGTVSPNEVLTTFLETFDIGGTVENKVTLSEFINYYSNIGCNIENDDYFFMMVSNVWHINEDVVSSEASGRRSLTVRNDGTQYVEESRDTNHAEDSVASKLKNQGPSELSSFSSKGISGASHDLTLHKLVLLNKRRSFHHKSSIDILADVSVKKKPSIDRPLSQPSAGVQVYLNRLSKEIKERGVQSLISLQRAFRAADIDDNKLLSLAEFKLGMRDMFLGLEESDLRSLFGHFDITGSGIMDYEQFIQAIRNPLSDWRTGLVKVGNH